MRVGKGPQVNQMGESQVGVTVQWGHGCCDPALVPVSVEMDKSECGPSLEIGTSISSML